jgi:Lrp/AsnC family transcriptional regulator, leucine-responsive regulatory protein
MTLNHEKLLDDVGWKLLNLLQEDARRSFSELGRIVGLSSPAVAERVRRMEELGIITGYHATVNVLQLGAVLTAFIRVNTSLEQCDRLATAVKTLPEVIEFYSVTGNDSFFLKVITTSIIHLESLINRLASFGPVTTSIILSSPIQHQVIREDWCGHGPS